LRRGTSDEKTRKKGSKRKPKKTLDDVLAGGKVYPTEKGKQNARRQGRTGRLKQVNGSKTDVGENWIISW